MITIILLTVLYMLGMIFTAYKVTDGDLKYMSALGWLGFLVGWYFVFTLVLLVKLWEIFVGDWDL